MAAKKKDPTDAIRSKASRFPGVEQGAACTQSSFKVGKKSFLFVGMQGGRYKLMFKLEDSLAEATALADRHPDNYGVGNTGWVSARFTAEDPMPRKLWEKWLDESYALSCGTGARARSTPKKAAKAAKSTKVKKKAGTKKTSTAKKRTARRK